MQKLDYKNGLAFVNLSVNSKVILMNFFGGSSHPVVKIIEGKVDTFSYGFVFWIFSRAKERKVY